MKTIFLIYWVWHCLIVVVQFLDPAMSMFVAKGFACMVFSSLFYISIIPFIYSSTAIRGTRNDVKWMYACMATITTRWTIQIVGIAFGQDIYYIVAIDMLTVLVYFGINWRFSNFSNSKWLSMYDRE